MGSAAFLPLRIPGGRFLPTIKKYASGVRYKVFDRSCNYFAPVTSRLPNCGTRSRIIWKSFVARQPSDCWSGATHSGHADTLRYTEKPLAFQVAHIFQSLTDYSAAGQAGTVTAQYEVASFGHLIGCARNYQTSKVFTSGEPAASEEVNSRAAATQAVLNSKKANLTTNIDGSTNAGNCNGPDRY
jgi:hypothetical protein